MSGPASLAQRFPFALDVVAWFVLTWHWLFKIGNRRLRGLRSLRPRARNHRRCTFAPGHLQVLRTLRLLQLLANRSALALRLVPFG